ncbi:hypothetical protein fh0823_01340 [Francisella halioticida]|nr:hypothetical protein [Francisella halioticida]BCD89995.1 hypothetical protein fh0823_01340 [Francisella halioticida]
MQNLNKQGYNVTRNQVRYLMDKLGLQTIYPKPNTSAKSRDEHKVYSGEFFRTVFSQKIDVKLSKILSILTLPKYTSAGVL